MKTKLTFILSFIFSTFFLSSCTIEENFHFNDDLSGRYSFLFDYNALLSLDTTGTAGEEMSRGYDEMKVELEKIEGISNILIKSDNTSGIVEVSYDFSTIDAINKANYNTESGNYTKFFIVSGKKLSFIADFSKELEEYKDSTMNEKDLLENVDSFLDYTMTIHFDSKVKVIDIKNFNIIDDKTLSFTLNEASLTDDSSFNVKLK